MSRFDRFSFLRWKKPASVTQKIAESAEKSSLMPSTGKTHSILVADDQPAILDAVKMLLRSRAFRWIPHVAGQVVLECLAMREYDALLLDLNYTRDTTSGQEGIELLESIRAIDSQLPVVVMTAWGTIDLAVEAVPPWSARLHPETLG